MSVIDTLIFDRTLADVQRVSEINNKIIISTISSLTPEELSEYLPGMKGAYNYFDLNRIGEAIKFLANRFLTWDEIIPVTAKTNWNEKPSKSDVDAMLTDIKTLSDRVNLSYPSVPVSLDKMTYQTANTIEEILYLINQEIGNATIETNYAGMFYSGE